jgi:RNA recognition motif-containing protein
MFSAFGTITLFRLFKRKDGFTYSYITYETIEEAHRAIKYMNKTKIEDKILKVSFAVANCEPKKKKSYFKKENKNNMQDLKEFPKIGDKKRKKEMKL